MINIGEIDIEVKKIEVKDKLMQPTASKLVMCRVSDNGTGVPEEVEAQVGSPGFTTKGSYGTGYGLSAAKEYVETVGGKLDFTNIPDKGFVVELVLEEFDERKHR